MDNYSGPLIKRRGTLYESESEAEGTLLGKKELNSKCYVDKLSYDVLHLIFSFYTNSKWPENLCTMSILISHVCRRWRGYALDTPTLWTCLTFQRVGRRREWERELTFLERSKNAPLDISIFSWVGSNHVLSASTTAGILRILKPHLHHWRSIDIGIHTKGMRIIGDQLRYNSAPTLETLNLRVWDVTETHSRWRCRMFGGGLPKLRQWSSNFELLPLPSHIPHMPNLLVLFLRDNGQSSESLPRPGVEDIVAILSTCSKLRKVLLLVESGRRLGRSLHTINTPVLLTDLTSFGLHCMPDSTFDRICSLIKAPRLQSIHPFRSPRSIITVIASHNPFPGLEILGLDDDPDEDEPELTSYQPSVLQNAFSGLSSLKELIVRNQALPTHLFHVLQTYCPPLFSLELYNCTFTSSDCVRMVKARMESDALSSVDQLGIHMPTPDLPDDDNIWLQGNVPLFTLTTTPEQSVFPHR